MIAQEQLEVKVQDQPKLQDVKEVLDRLDRNWQGLVQLLKEGQVNPSTQMLETVKPASQGAAGDHPESQAPALPIDEDNHGLRQPMPDSLPLGKPEAGIPLSNSATEPNQVESYPEQLARKGWWQKCFNVTMIALLVATLGGLSFLIAQTQLGRGKVDTGMLTIRGKDGTPRAWIGERDGQISLCLVDNSGRSRVKVSLDASGNPSLCLLDELQQNRTEMKMGPGGEPLFSQIKEPALPSTHMDQASPLSDQKVAAAVAAVPESNDPQKLAAVPTSPETPVEDTEAKTPSIEPPVKYVGSRTSNKYHYPECKWAKMVLPERLLGFKSVEQAKGEGYIRCPVCKPPLTDSADLEVSK
jgi:hypothetical protein